MVKHGDGVLAVCDGKEEYCTLWASHSKSRIFHGAEPRRTDRKQMKYLKIGVCAGEHGRRGLDLSSQCSGFYFIFFFGGVSLKNCTPTWLCLVLFQSSAMGSELPKIALLLLL